jgi:hypothetical protein
MRLSTARPLAAMVIGALAVLLAFQLGGSPPSPATAATENAGYSDHRYGPSGAGSDPTADKPQSKLWHNDGFWWAVMFHLESGTYRIYRLNWPDNWVDTGTVVDDRPAARADVLWDSEHLYVASSTRYLPGNQGRLYRFSYNGDAKVYTRDPGFPAVMMTGGSESLTIDKDSTGKLWIAYTQAGKVWVNRSTGADAVWGTPFVLPDARNVDPDDIASLVAYNGNIGVVWSNHIAPTSMYFAYRRDGDPDTTWQPIQTIYQSDCIADDHINLKSLQADASGQIYAAVKTSLGDAGCPGGDSASLIRLVVRKANGSWVVTTFGTAADQHTRPIVLLDRTNRRVYMFATSPTSCGTIYMKSTSMDNPSFPTGRGEPFISSSTYDCINNATSTKQTLDAGTDLVVLAADEEKLYYLHNVIDLPGTPPTPTATQPATATPTATLTPSITPSPTPSATVPPIVITPTPTGTVIPDGPTATPQARLHLPLVLR